MLSLSSEAAAKEPLQFAAIDMVSTPRADGGQVYGLGAVPSRLENGDLTTPITIVATSDGGITWHKRSEIDAITVYDLELVSPWRAYAIAHRGRSPTVLLRTDDGGMTWRLLPSRPESGLHRVTFLGEEVGWGVAFHSLDKTEDGGATWTSVHQPCSDRWTPTGVYFRDEAIGWLLCHDGAALGHTAKRLYRTVDGGVTWELLAAGDADGPQGLPFAGSADDLVFIGDIGWLTLTTVGGVSILSSHDGGKTWSSDGFATDSSGLFIGSLDFIDGKDGWVLSGRRYSSSGELYATADGGASWHPVGASLIRDPSAGFPRTGAGQPAGTSADWAIPLAAITLGAALVAGLLAFRRKRSAH